MSTKSLKALSTQVLGRLFPLPSQPPSSLASARPFGITSESTEALLKALRENHEKWHIFFNERGFHNHATHHLLAIYALGAPGPLIEAAYKTHTAYQRPMDVLGYPGPITKDNFFDHLGKANERYYISYLRYFNDILEKDDADVAAVIEEYIFSKEFNFNPAFDAENKPQPEMLNRFLAGLVHPMIHLGFGLEFGLKGMVAEGLAQMAIHDPESTLLFPKSFFDRVSKEHSEESTVSHVTNFLNNLVLIPGANSAGGYTCVKETSGKHIFIILSKMLKDTRLTAVVRSLSKLERSQGGYDYVLKECGDVLREYAEEWNVDDVGRAPDELERKMDELFWAQTLIYGVGGWREGKDFNANFLLMHFVTSILQLPSVIAYLKPASQRALLHSYLVVCLAFWMAIGRPGFSIAKFYNSTSAHLNAPGPHPTPDKEALAPNGMMEPNVWYAILQTTIMHPNEHLPKLQRALAHGASVYGIRPRGYFASVSAKAVDDGLEGAELLDGTIFARVASLTASRLGWMREGEKQANWDREAFFE